MLTQSINSGTKGPTSSQLCWNCTKKGNRVGGGLVIFWFYFSPVKRRILPPPLSHTRYWKIICIFFSSLSPVLATSCEWLFCFCTERRAFLPSSSDSKCHLATAFSRGREAGGALPARLPACCPGERAGGTRRSGDWGGLKGRRATERVEMRPRGTGRGGPADLGGGGTGEMKWSGEGTVAAARRTKADADIKRAFVRGKCVYVCACVCAGGAHPARSKLPCGGGHLRLVYRRRGAHRRVYPAHTTRGSPPLLPAPTPIPPPRRGEAVGGDGTSGAAFKGGVARSGDADTSKTQPPPSRLPVGSVQAQAVTGRRENYIIPAPVMLPFVPLPCAQGNKRGRASPPRIGLTPGGWGGEGAPPRHSYTYTPARVFTALTQAYCDVSWVTARHANGGWRGPRRQGRTREPRPHFPPLHWDWSREHGGVGEPSPRPNASTVKSNVHALVLGWFTWCRLICVYDVLWRFKRILYTRGAISCERGEVYL